MLFKKPYSQWSSEEKKQFGKDAITYAKELGLPLKKKSPLKLVKK
jgi:hypothetical protein